MGAQIAQRRLETGPFEVDVALGVIIGVAVAIGPGRRALLISLFVLVGLAAVCIAVPQTAGLFLLGFTDLSMQWGVPFVKLGGIAFVLPGLTCAADHLLFER